MSYYDELAAAGYRDVTGCLVHSPQPVGEPTILRHTIGQPADLHSRGTWYASGQLRSIILDCGTVLVAGLHGPAEDLSNETLRRLAPNGREVFYLLPTLARGDLVIPADVLARCKPLPAPVPVSVPEWSPRRLSLEWYLDRQTPVHLQNPTHMVDASQIPEVRRKLPRRRVNTRKPLPEVRRDEASNPRGSARSHNPAADR